MRQPDQSHSLLGEIQSAVNQFILEILEETLPQTAYYHQLQGIIGQTTASGIDEPSIDMLPVLVCKANEGDTRKAIPITAAWQLLRRAAKLFDDVEDGDIHSRAAEAINAATGLLFVANLILGRLQTQGESTCSSPSQAFSRAIVRACVGQHADLVISGQADSIQTDPETWLEIAGAKSGELLAWATWAGAWVAGVDEEMQTCYYQYGYHLGVLLQVADDFNGVWHFNEESDLSAGQLNLALCYALSVVEAKERDALAHLIRQGVQGNLEVEKQVRQRLTELGAQGYLLVVGRMQRQQAIDALPVVRQNSLAHQQLITLLDKVMPVIGGALSGQEF